MVLTRPRKIVCRKKKNVVKVDGMVSCLASRSGTKSDSFAIDYQATLNCLEGAKKEGVAHFVMLSAFCVKKPTLQVIRAYDMYDVCVCVEGVT